MTSPTAQSPRFDRPLRLLLWLLNAVLVLGLLVFFRPLLVWALNIASPFFVALIIAYIFNPIVGLVQRRFHVSRTVGVVLTFALILGLTVGALMLFVPILVAQFRMGLTNLADRIPLVVAALSEKFQVSVSPEDIERLRAAIEGKISMDNLANQLTPAMRGVASQLAHAVTSFSRFVAAVAVYSAGVAAFLVLVLMITFYCLVDFARIGRFLGILIPSAFRPRFLSIWEKVDSALGGFLRGQLIVCVIIGSLYSLALIALGMKQYSLLIGFAAGFGNLIPYVGPVIGAVPTILWVVFGGVYQTAGAKIIGVLAVLLISVMIQTLDGFILQPRIVGKSAGLHPLVVIAALVVGAQFGLGGLILAVPTAIVLRVILRELWWMPLANRRARETTQSSEMNLELPKKSQE
jgi:predicted PurR-regulated permease PerM